MLNSIFDEERPFLLFVNKIYYKPRYSQLKSFNFRITDWEHFEVGKDFYLLAGNSLRPGKDSKRYKNHRKNSIFFILNFIEICLTEVGPNISQEPRSILYKWRGEELFQPVNFIPEKIGEVSGNKILKA